MLNCSGGSIEAISSLPPTQARRVHARYMLGMKVKDIAAMEGIHSIPGGEVHPCGAPAAAPVLHAPEMDKRLMKTINPEKVLLSPLRNGHFHRTAGRRLPTPSWRNGASTITPSSGYGAILTRWTIPPGLEYHLLYHALSAEDTLLEEETRREQEEAHD